MNDGRKNGRTDWQTDGLTDDGGTDGWRRDWRTDGWLRDWRTEGLMDRRTEGRTDGRTDRRTDGRTDGWTDERYGSNTFYDEQGRFCNRSEILFNMAMLKCFAASTKISCFPIPFQSKPVCQSVSLIAWLYRFISEPTNWVPSKYSDKVITT